MTHVGSLAQPPPVAVARPPVRAPGLAGRALASRQNRPSEIRRPRTLSGDWSPHPRRAPVRRAVIHGGRQGQSDRRARPGDTVSGERGSARASGAGPGILSGRHGDAGHRPRARPLPGRRPDVRGRKPWTRLSHIRTRDRRRSIHRRVLRERPGQHQPHHDRDRSDERGLALRDLGDPVFPVLGVPRPLEYWNAVHAATAAGVHGHLDDRPVPDRARRRLPLFHQLEPVPVARVDRHRAREHQHLLSPLRLRSPLPVDELRPVLRVPRHPHRWRVVASTRRGRDSGRRDVDRHAPRLGPHGHLDAIGSDRLSRLPDLAAQPPDERTADRVHVHLVLPDLRCLLDAGHQQVPGSHRLDVL